MVDRPSLQLCALLAALGCAPELKPGTDRADVVVVADAPAVDVVRDVAVDLPRDAGTSSDLGADVPRPSTAQTSCPSPGELGCGMVEVAGGTFTMGAPNTPRTIQAYPEQPLISVGSFALDAYEVTVARFRRYWTTAPHSAAVGAISYPGAVVRVVAVPREPDLATADEPCNWTPSAQSREQHPINCIDWATAQAFCVWDGGRLPTEAEWEFAARGRAVGGLATGRLYPWGDEDPSATCDRARWNQFRCTGEDGGQTRRVGSFPPAPDLAGARLYDLSGNVFEWVADNFVDYSLTKGADCWRALPAGRRDPVCDVAVDGARSLRGGSWYYDNPNVFTAASRSGASPGGTLRLHGAGMRCARSR